LNAHEVEAYGLTVDVVQTPQPVPHDLSPAVRAVKHDGYLVGPLPDILPYIMCMYHIMSIPAITIRLKPSLLIAGRRDRPARARRWPVQAERKSRLSSGLWLGLEEPNWRYLLADAEYSSSVNASMPAASARVVKVIAALSFRRVLASLHDLTGTDED